MGFLPDNYKPLQNPAGSYMKLLPGDNKIRILGDFNAKPPTAILGFIGWLTTTDAEGKPARRPERTPPGVDLDTSKYEEKPKEFWALIVWNYGVEAIQIWEVTQRGIQNELVSLAEDEAWKDLSEFDVSVNRSGEGLETRYSVMPKPKAEISAEVKEAYEKSSIDLVALFSGDDPFEPRGNPLADPDF